LKIYAQRIGGDGVVQWTANGVPVSTLAGYQWSSKVIPDDAGGAIIVWEDRNPTSSELYTQRLNGAGVPQWGLTGIPISIMPPGESKVSLKPVGIVPSPGGGAIVVWRNYSHIWGQSVDSAGNLLWSTSKKLGIDSVPRDYRSVVSDGIGGVFVAWEAELPCCDWPFGAIGMLMLRVSSAGDVQWDIVAREANQWWDQTSSQLIPDGIGGAIIVWQTDFVVRSPFGYPPREERSPDIHAQHVSASGQLQW